MAKTGLGKGLDLLIPKSASAGGPEAKKPEKKKPNEPEPSENIVTLKISRIEPNKEQPRKVFDEESIGELADSIKQYGLIQPIVVRKNGDFYEIIAGERRWRASKKAGLKEVPVVIREYEDRERAEISLIENIQRENLNAIEEAMAYKQLIDEYDLTQEELSQKISKSRTAIANTMRLLKLLPEVQKMVIDGKLSGGHARALLGLENEEAQLKAANKIIEGGLNVRQTEELVRALNAPKKSAEKKKPDNDFLYKDIEDKMTESFGTKVKITRKENGSGKIEISYYSEQELDRIYNLINNLTD